jgi:transcriptional regulator with XRE-family HTH domain
MPKGPHKLRGILGVNIRAERERQGLSQEQLAEAADMSQQYLSDIERGQRRVTVDIIEVISKSLGVRPGRLLD